MIGKKRNGTLVNGGQLVPGIVGNAIEFNGTNEEYVEYGFINESCMNNMDDCTDGVTITFWTDSVFTSNPITILAMGCDMANERQGIRVEIGPNTLILNARFSDERQLAMFDLVPTGWIHHGLIIKKGQEPQYLINGTVPTKQGSAFWSTTSSIGGTVRIGSRFESVDVHHFNGKIDDVRLWKVAKCPEFVMYIFDMYKK